MASEDTPEIVEWRNKLKDAATPAWAEYRATTRPMMATDTGAVTKRDDAIVAAWVALGVDEATVRESLRRGSGAVEWLLVHWTPPKKT